MSMLKKKYKETIIQEDICAHPKQTVFVCFCILRVFLKKIKFFLFFFFILN
jgi:hypothetical protein